MKSPNQKLFTRWNTASWVVIILGCGYVYAGFFFPDPVLSKLHWGPQAVLLGIKIIIPIILLGAVYFFYAIRVGKTKPGAVVLLSIALLVFASILYPVGDYFYQKSLSKKLDEFHSLLQIIPPGVPIVEYSNYNIFCLGGSTTEFKDKAGRDWTKMVEDKLSDEVNSKKIKFYNLGRQWYTSQHILTNYIQNIRQHKPDMLIVMVNINDLLHNADFSRFSKGDFREDYGHFLGPLTNVINRTSLLQMIIQTVKQNWYYTEPEEVNSVSFSGLKSFENNINTLIDLCSMDRIKVLLMTEPNIYKEAMPSVEMEALHMLNTEAIGNGKKWSLQTAMTGLSAYNQVIKQTASKRGTMLIDLDKVVPKSLEYFYDDVHYKDQTYDLISDYISGELKKLKPWKK
ncbi:MAG: SGNH/GDSL hydrolase family protein [Ignavibacteriales bacterium]|nr:MAG: SGNH/GDSL hydrolase family protein [Ignavibacteriales bacterium]